MNEFLRFRPIPQERVWGGRALETTLGRELPPGDRPFGESWEIVDRPEAQSVVVGGKFAGLTLRELMEQHSAEIMGPRWPAGKPFPILVKWLDCRERLSLQVHPPAAVAKELGGEPTQFEAAVAAGRVEDCVNRFPVAAGDSVLVRSGIVHAIDGGNLILEIQQNSDTTYRVDDWGRVGLDGKPRQLHLAESLQSILWEAALPPVVKAGKTPALLANASEFQIRRVPLAWGETLRFAADEQPRILSIVEGRLTSAGGELVSGDNVMLPFAGEFVFNASENAVVLVTENFSEIDQERITLSFTGREKFNTENLAVAWLEHTRRGSGDDEFFWAVERIWDLANKDPETLWLIILRLVELASDDLLLANVAAGPLEDILCLHGALLIERVEFQAWQDKKFRRCLSGVWGMSRMPAVIQTRVRKAAGAERL